MPVSELLRGRPSVDDAHRRKGEFLVALAEGMSAADACRKARISPWRALSIVTESDFQQILEALRDGLAQAA